MSIGHLIKEQRLRNNLSQEEVAKAIGSTKQAVYKYENGIVTNIPMDKIETMASLFGVTPSYLMGWDEAPNLNIQLFAENSPEEHRLTEGERLWLELYRRVSPDTRNLLIKLVDSFDGISEEKQKLALQLIRVAFGDLE